MLKVIEEKYEQKPTIPKSEIYALVPKIPFRDVYFGRVSGTHETLG
jgi:hypothetical protein